MTSKAERFVCTSCGFVDGPGPKCTGCGDVIFDRAGLEDRATLREFYAVRKGRRNAAGFVIAFCAALPFSLFLPIPLVVLALIFLLPTAIVIELLVPARHRAIERMLDRNKPRPPIAIGRRISSVPVLFSLIVLAAWVAENIKPESMLAWALVPSELHARAFTIVSYALLHASVGHVVGNVAAMLLYGTAVDLRVGRIATLGILGASIVAGGLTHAFLTDTPNVPTIGASSAAYGLMGATLALMPRRKVIIAAGGLVTALPAAIIIPAHTGVYALLDATGTTVAWLGHLGGFAAGVAAGWILTRRPPPSAFLELERQREERLAKF